MWYGVASIVLLFLPLLRALADVVTQTSRFLVARAPDLASRREFRTVNVRVIVPLSVKIAAFSAMGDAP
jgi:hypothetical protein